jgi:hypothetical protein
VIRRPGDKEPEPPGGRAAERLRMFDEARRPHAPQGSPRKKTDKRNKRSKKGDANDEEQTRPKN